MAHLQYMPGDPRLVDQLVYELKSKGIFDQFRKDCISDVDTRPAYQNLRQRVESSVSLFLSRQTWQSDLNKNQLREKLRKHILDGNYLEQGVERIVDQVVNPKVASVFIPQVEDLVYNYLGIARKKSTPEASNDKGGSSTDLLPTDLEAVSPGSVKSDDDAMEDKEDKMEIDTDDKSKDFNEISMPSEPEQEKETDTRLSGVSDLTSRDSDNSLGKLSIPMPSEEINLENIPSPENSPPKIDLDSIEMPKEEHIELKDIPLPDESPKDEKEQFFKSVNSEDDSSSDSSIIRNMSPLTPIRNFNNENSCDAQQAFENDTDSKSDDKKEPSSFRFTIETKSPENSSDGVKDKELKPDKEEQQELSYQFTEQININAFNTPLYDDSSNSHNLQIDYESDVNSKTNLDKIPFPDDPNSEDSKKEATEEKKVHKSSHRSRDSHRHSSSKDRRTDSKPSSSKDRRDSKHDKKTSKDDQSKSKSSSDKSKDRGDKKDGKDSKHKSSHSSHKSSSSKDSKHRSSSSSQRHSSKHDDKKSSSSSKDKEKTSDKSSKEHRSSKDSKSRSDKDRKNKRDEKDKDKKDKKDSDDHYSASGRGNHTRRSTDRDSNDGSSSSKGSHQPSSSKSSEIKTNKGSSSKSDNTSPSSQSISPSDKEKNNKANLLQCKPIVRVDTHLERPVGTPPRLPFVPDVTLKKPKFAANLAEAKRLMKMRKFLDEEQKRMNQEATLLLEFQANVRPSLSQVYSSISGPELEFACVPNVVDSPETIIETSYAEVQPMEQITDVPDAIEMELTEMNRETKEIVHTKTQEITEDVEIDYYQPIEYKANFEDSEKILNEISKKVYGVVDEEDANCETEHKPKEEVTEGMSSKKQIEFEVTVVTEEINEIEAVNELETHENDEPISNKEIASILEEKAEIKYEDRPLEYFAEHEKFDAELERAKFEKFLKEYITTTVTNKLYLINCDAYEESIVKEVSEAIGQFEIVNYHKNGHKKNNIVKNVNVSNEIVLPLDRNTNTNTPVNSIKSPMSPVFSPVKSECSFELSSDYDARLEEMVNKTSRQEIMEIILGGGAPLGSPCKMPQIDYCMDENIDSVSNQEFKRKLSVETDNNNRQVLTPSKIRKLSESDQISSTTEEAVDDSSSGKTSVVRSKYLGKARRVGLPRPKRNAHSNSPSSDKSVENYDTNTPPNGKLNTQRKVQRYDTSDLYKPKIHYLSRRNNIS